MLPNFYLMTAVERCSIKILGTASLPAFSLRGASRAFCQTTAASTQTSVEPIKFSVFHQTSTESWPQFRIITWIISKYSHSLIFGPSEKTAWTVRTVMKSVHIFTLPVWVQINQPSEILEQGNWNLSNRQNLKDRINLNAWLDSPFKMINSVIMALANTLSF